MRRSQHILEKWSNLFDQNSIRTGIILSINNKSKDEVLVALSETIEQIAIPLQDYLSKSDNNEFYDISVNDTTFDILIDKSTVKTLDANSLKNTISIIIIAVLILWISIHLYIFSFLKLSLNLIYEIKR